MTDSRHTMRWLWRGIALAALLIGWVFIAWQNHFHISAPVVFVCLGYLAVIATVANLWRTGAAAVAAGDEVDSTWAKPVGALGELEREKRTLLKAIKEAEFDHQMGKLSKHDVDEMIRTYRARAIEVIKEIDRLGSGATGSAREQIMREVRARLELEGKSQKKSDAKASKPAEQASANGAEPASDKTGQSGQSSKSSKSSKPGKGNKDKAKGQPTAAGSAVIATPVIEASGGDAVANGAAHERDASGAETTAAEAAKAAAASQALDDEAMDADSTTTVEPKREDAAKEATP